MLIGGSFLSMVKRQSKRGRRQILQLEDKKSCPASSTSSQSTKQVLTQYSDSDDEKDTDDVGSTEHGPIDTQVADFLKEIDALTGNDGEPSTSAKETTKPLVEESSKTVESSVKSANGSTSTDELNGSSTVSQHDASEGYCMWQQCSDEGSGYTYFWNVVTNDVTWECPPEYLAYQKYLERNAATSTTGQRISESKAALKKLPKKTVAKRKEGAIIPISYYGDSSESSGEENSSNVPDSPVSKKQSSKPQKKKTEAIGPQLPPGFLFPPEVSMSPQSSNDNNNSGPIFGPQLPPGLFPAEKTSHSSPSSSRPDDDDMEGKACIQSTAPDSTKNILPLRTSSKSDTSQGFKLVVEYDSFTDTEEEEEMQIVCSSSTNLISKDAESKPFSPKSAELTENSGQEPDDSKASTSAISTVLKTDIQQPMEVEEPVEPVSESFVSKQVKESPPLKEDNSDSDNGTLQSTVNDKTPGDIVNDIFTTASSGKYGFGFSRKDQLDLEEGNRKKTHSSSSRRNRGKNYPMIGFVKSKHKLDLNSINKNKKIQSKIQAENEISVTASSSNNVVKSGTADVQSEDIAVPKPPASTVETTVSVPEDTVVTVEPKKKKKSKKKNDTQDNEEHSKSVKKEEPSKNPLGEEDIDELLGNILKEMVQSKASGSTPSEEKPAEDTRKRPLSVDSPPTSTVKKIKTEEPIKEEEKQGLVDDAALSSEIINLSTLLTDKLTCLVVNQSTLTSLSTLFVQIQTRLLDWQAGALDSKYFMDRLQDINQYIQHYEKGAGTGDWAYQWDRENKRYYYYNKKTGECQWNFPAKNASSSSTVSNSTWVNPNIDTIPQNGTFQVSNTQFPLVSSSISEEQSNKPAAMSTTGFAMHTTKQEMKEPAFQSKAKWMRESSPPPPPPGVDSPPPPPPPPVTPPAESPPPPPPDSTEGMDNETPTVDMDLDSDSSDSASFIRSTNYKQDESHMQNQLNSFYLECTSTIPPAPFAMGAVSSTSINLVTETAHIAKPPKPVMNDRFASQTMWASSSFSSIRPPDTNYSIPQNEVTAQAVSAAPSVPRVEKVENTITSEERNLNEPVATCSTATSAPSTSTENTSSTKKEKKKTKLRTGLLFKKKNIPSLVEKWKKIKAEQDKEDTNEFSD